MVWSWDTFFLLKTVIFIPFFIFATPTTVLELERFCKRESDFPPEITLSMEGFQNRSFYYRPLKIMYIFTDAYLRCHSSVSTHESSISTIPLPLYKLNIC